MVWLYQRTHLIDMETYAGHHLLDGFNMLGALNLQSGCKILDGLDIVDNLNELNGHKMLDGLKVFDMSD